MSLKKTTLLCILDGWGYRTETEHNPILLEDTPVWEKLCAEFPQSFLEASGEAVGLPMGQIGNSEVGHLTLGAGRIMLQTLPRINEALKNGFLENYTMLNDALKNIGTHNKVHIMGLLSDGGVHSHQDHIIALANYIDRLGKNLVIHAFTDGRDCAPQSFKTCLQKFTASTNAPIATLVGRYFAMDRDNNWERTREAFNLILGGNADGNIGGNFETADAAIDAYYAEGVTDEFIPATNIDNYDGMKDGDIFMMANFRADRVRQILTLLAGGMAGDDANCEKINTLPVFAHRFGMCAYSEELAQKLSVFFPRTNIENPLGAVISRAGKTQLRLAETEKFAHVTYFLNGGAEKPYNGEDRILVPSPKVKTYDLQPEMSAGEVTQKLCDAILAQKYDFIMVNFANPDMIGHTGNMAAARKTVAVTDESLGKIITALDSVGGEMLLTADHGNIETMFDVASMKPHTAHTLNPVKLIYYGGRKLSLNNGTLADIAPSILALMALDQPAEMDGKCLITF